MIPKRRLEEKVDKLNLIVKSMQGILYRIDANIDREEFAEARGDLSDLSNKADDAMHLIDELMAPDPTIWDDPHCP